MVFCLRLWTTDADPEPDLPVQGLIGPERAEVDQNPFDYPSSVPWLRVLVQVTEPL